MSLTPDRLGAIRQRSRWALQAYLNGTCGTPPNLDGLTVREALDYTGESAEDVPALLDEVDRLRGGVAEARDHVWESWIEQGDAFLLDRAVTVLDSLLNPTEGEDR